MRIWGEIRAIDANYRFQFASRSSSFTIFLTLWLQIETYLNDIKGTEMPHHNFTKEMLKDFQRINLLQNIELR